MANQQQSNQKNGLIEKSTNSTNSDQRLENQPGELTGHVAAQIAAQAADPNSASLIVNPRNADMASTFIIYSLSETPQNQADRRLNDPANVRYGWFSFQISSNKVNEYIYIINKNLANLFISNRDGGQTLRPLTLTTFLVFEEKVKEGQVETGPLFEQEPAGSYQTGFSNLKIIYSLGPESVTKRRVSFIKEIFANIERPTVRLTTGSIKKCFDEVVSTLKNSSFQFLRGPKSV